METININLLPGRKHKKKLSKEDKQVIFIGFSIFFLLFAMYAGVLYTKSKKTRELDNLNTQINALTSVQKVLDLRNALGSKVFYYEASIKNFTLKQTDWNNLVDIIAQSLPKETKINQLSIDKGTMLITISGVTKNLQTLAWTVYAIENNKDLSNVILKSYNVPYGGTTRSQGPTYTTFTITFKWKGMKK